MSTIVCAISGNAAEEPVFAPKTGHIYEKRLIEKQIEAEGKCPVTKEEITKDDLMDIKTNKSVRPRPATATSIPGMLTLLQSEWDALMSETYELKAQLDTSRKQLSHALYQHDAACRVIARLIRERDMARTDNQKLQEQLSHSTPLPGGAVREDAETGLTPEILQKMKELADTLSKTRKRKDFPDLNPLAQLKKFTCVGSHPIHKSTAPGITCVDIHRSDAKRVVTGGMDAQVIVFDAEKEKMQEKLLGHAKKITAVALHPTKDVVLSASQDATVKVWTSSAEWTGPYTCSHTIRKHAGEVSDISIHPLGDYFLSAGLDKSWAVFELESGRCVKHLRELEHGYNCMKWHPDGMILASGTQGGPVQIWDIKEQKVVASLTGHEDAVKTLSFSGNGYHLATGSEDGTVKLWDLRKPLNIQTLQLSAPVNSVAFDSTGQYLSVASDVVQIYNWASKSSMAEAVTLKDHGAAVLGVCFSQHAMSLASVSMDRTLKIFKNA
mmetsp:Transcript_12451/g.29608  ORF Transcript_12451/g.29608 Transcript_12451/m.29608 type:complete len:496 (+) Transcript_12451:38-1525(+)